MTVPVDPSGRFRVPVLQTGPHALRFELFGASSTCGLDHLVPGDRTFPSGDRVVSFEAGSSQDLVLEPGRATVTVRGAASTARRTSNHLRLERVGMVPSAISQAPVIEGDLARFRGIVPGEYRAVVSGPGVLAPGGVHGATAGTRRSAPFTVGPDDAEILVDLPEEQGLRAVR